MTFAARLRALIWFIISVIYFVFAREVAIHAARGLASPSGFGSDWL
ncbi:MAG: hypothetical protein JO300_02865, partial [Silvibacterium sp.]|nr:hypothetical protein [Silvibacterium sp.]